MYFYSSFLLSLIHMLWFGLVCTHYWLTTVFLWWKNNKIIKYQFKENEKYLNIKKLNIYFRFSINLNVLFSPLDSLMILTALFCLLAWWGYSTLTALCCARCVECSAYTGWSSAVSVGGKILCSYSRVFVSAIVQ